MKKKRNTEMGSSANGPHCDKDTIISGREIEKARQIPHTTSTPSLILRLYSAMIMPII